MPYTFFDTSALVKRYYEEDGTDRVDTLIDDPETTVLITSLSILETVSAFRRKYNSGDITEHEMEALLVVFFREALTDFVILPVDETMHGDAFDLIVDDEDAGILVVEQAETGDNGDSTAQEPNDTTDSDPTAQEPDEPTGGDGGFDATVLAGLLTIVVATLVAIVLWRRRDEEHNDENLD